jgi:transaldolase
VKFFIDTANLDEIREAAAWGILAGVTTNPSLIVKEGRDLVDTIAEICDLVDGPISAETVAPTAEEMVRQGKLLARIHDNVVIKVPLNEAGITACHRLSSEGIGVNVTLCFQPAQALVAARAGATFISPFIGRIDDVATDGMELIEQIVAIYAQAEGITTQVLAASIRHPLHVTQAALAGADVATVPFKVLKQIFRHPLTDIGNDQFNAAWESAGNPDIAAQVTAWLERNGR